MSIRIKVITISVLILFISLGINLFVTASYFTDEYSSARKDEVFVIASTLKSQLDRLLKMHIPLSELVGFEVICQEAVSQHQIITYAMVVDTNGKILFHNDPTYHNQTIEDYSLLQLVKNNKKAVLESIIKDEVFYDFFVPIHGSQSEVIGYIRTGFPRSHILSKTRRLAIYTISITCALFFLGSMLLVALLYNWVSKPILHFSNTIEDIRKNWSADESRAVMVSSNDEIGQLAKVFNQMTQELRLTTVTKDYFDSILKNMLNSLIITDEKYTILSANLETYNLLGYKQDELVGMSIFDILDKSGNPIDETDALTEGNSLIRAVETNYISKKGEYIPILFSFSRLKRRDEYKEFICVAQDITEIETLRGFLPICASCKKIRDDKGYWNQIEKYISDHSQAQFSHSICPDCVTELYADFAAKTNSSTTET